MKFVPQRLSKDRKEKVRIQVYLEDPFDAERFFSLAKRYDLSDSQLGLQMIKHCLKESGDLLDQGDK